MLWKCFWHWLCLWLLIVTARLPLHGMKMEPSAEGGLRMVGWGGRGVLAGSRPTTIRMRTTECSPLSGQCAVCVCCQAWHLPFFSGHLSHLTACIPPRQRTATMVSTLFVYFYFMIPISTSNKHCLSSRHQWPLAFSGIHQLGVLMQWRTVAFYS